MIHSSTMQNMNINIHTDILWGETRSELDQLRLCSKIRCTVFLAKLILPRLDRCWARHRYCLPQLHSRVSRPGKFTSFSSRPRQSIQDKAIRVVDEDATSKPPYTFSPQHPSSGPRSMFTTPAVTIAFLHTQIRRGQLGLEAGNQQVLDTC